MDQKNYNNSQKDYAVYLPAISTFYSTYISKQRYDKFVPDDRIPKGFDRGVEGMNFLNPEQGYFTYKHGLYSAGHAQLDLDKAIKQDSMIQERDRSNTLILGDSGGFQIGKGVIKFDWQDFKGKNANSVRDKILNWLELTADWSMVLDVPTWASNDLHRPKTGLNNFQECLDATVWNNEYFIKNRLGQTKFLNVLQGNSPEECDIWYDAVKHLPFEGWAMGGQNMCNMPIILNRLLKMRDEGLLQEKNWMHFLGTAPLDWACYLTSIQRVLRKHVNPNLTISFDCASPYIAVAYGLAYTVPSHRRDKWSIIMEKAPDSKLLSGTDHPFPWASSIGDRLTMGDVCWYKPGMLNKVNKEGKTSWDSFSYALYMAHNTEVHIDAVQRANRLMDMESARYTMDWTRWKKLSDKEAKHDEPSDWVPRNILYFDQFVEELFATSDPYKMLANQTVHRFLTELQGGMQRGKLQNDFFNKLIEFEDPMPSNDDLADMNNDKIIELEHTLDEQSD
jgi:hypothetical protein